MPTASTRVRCACSRPRLTYCLTSCDRAACLVWFQRFAPARKTHIERDRAFLMKPVLCVAPSAPRPAHACLRAAFLPANVPGALPRNLLLTATMYFAAIEQMVGAVNAEQAAMAASMAAHDGPTRRLTQASQGQLQDAIASFASGLPNLGRLAEPPPPPTAPAFRGLRLRVHLAFLPFTCCCVVQFLRGRPHACKGDNAWSLSIESEGLYRALCPYVCRHMSALDLLCAGALTRSAAAATGGSSAAAAVSGGVAAAAAAAAAAPLSLLKVWHYQHAHEHMHTLRLTSAMKETVLAEGSTSPKSS